MSSFTTPLKLEPIPGGRWRLLERFTYHMGRKDSGHSVHCEAGERTDFASIPRALWPLLPPWADDYGKAAVIHDHLYRRKVFTRAVCDAIFLEAMQVLGCPSWKRYLIYKAVRYFGWFVWWRNNYPNPPLR